MTTAPKTPTDHQKSADVLRAEALAERPEGHELLRDVETLRSAEAADAQASIFDLFEEMGLDMSTATNGEEVQIDPSPAVIRAMGKLGLVLERFAVDPDEFVKFDTGKGSGQRVMALAMWYLSALGE
jgi:hypothetical protein